MPHENDNMRWDSSKEIFQDYLNLWDEALRKGIFDDPSLKPQKVKEISFFEGFKSTKPAEKLNKDQFEEWTQIYRMSVGEDRPPIINEAKKAQENKDSAANFKSVKDSKKKNLRIEKKVKDLASSPTPVQHPTDGADGMDSESGRTRITAGFSADEGLEKLEELKKDIYKLEVKMSDKDGMNEKKAKSIQKQILKLKDKIEEISNSFGGNFTNSQEHD